MITILIPTLNRSEFLIRQLIFLDYSGYKGKILIGDSSNKTHQENLLNALPKLSINKNINYFYYPNMSDAQVMHDMVKKIETPYSVMIGDDDLLIPSSLDEAIHFLEDNNDYIAAHGKSFKIKLLGDKCHGKIIEFDEYKQPALESAIALERVYDLFTDYSTPLFCVHRSYIWSKIYENTDRYHEKTFHRELAPSLVAPIYGKYKELDNIFMFRQFHSGQYLLKGIVDWVLDEKFFISFDLLKEEITNTIAAQGEKIEYSDVAYQMNKAMSIYLNTHIQTKQNNLFRIFFYKYFIQFQGYIRYLRYKLVKKYFNEKLFLKMSKNKQFNEVIQFLEKS